MNVLALDLATHTGWALMENDRLESGVQVFDVKRGESPGMRYVRFNRWLQSVVFPATEEGFPRASMAPPRVNLIVYEQTVPFPAKFGGASAREISAGFATRVQEFCAIRLIEHATVYPSTLKKWTTGKGNAKKADMLAAVSDRWLAVTDDNQADAIALLYHALAEIVPVGAR